MPELRESIHETGPGHFGVAERGIMGLVNQKRLRRILTRMLDFKIECPTGSGNLMNLFEVAREITNRLTRIFLRDESGRRPVFGGAEKFQQDPHWQDNLLFYEYFHGDNGAGIGASHQTGWTGVIAGLIDIFGKLDAETFLRGGRGAVFGRETETA
jgi:hypothetical protein